MVRGCDCRRLLAASSFGRGELPGCTSDTSGSEHGWVLMGPVYNVANALWPRWGSYHATLCRHTALTAPQNYVAKCSPSFTTPHNTKSCSRLAVNPSPDSMGAVGTDMKNRNHSTLSVVQHRSLSLDQRIILYCRPSPILVPIIFHHTPLSVPAIIYECRLIPLSHNLKVSQCPRNSSSHHLSTPQLASLSSPRR